MSLKPLHFVTGQDLYDFRSRLQQNDLINLNSELTKQHSILFLTSYLVRGTDGNLYVLDDLKKLPPEVTQNSKLEFFYAPTSGKKPKKVTLEQLLAASPSSDAGVLNSIPLLIYLNSELYRDSLPELMCSTDMESLAESWCRDMTNFYAKLEASDTELWAMESSYFNNNLVPSHALPLEFINHVKIDILTITFFQQERLYAYLLKLKEREPASDSLNNWLTVITENNQKIKEHLESYRIILNKSRRVYHNHSSGVYILHEQLKSQQKSSFMLNLLRISMSLAMIIGLHWYSLGYFTALLLYTMFVEPLALEAPGTFIVTCLFCALMESLLVSLCTITIGFCINLWEKYNNEEAKQLNQKILACQQIEEYITCNSTWSVLLNHLDIALQRIDNFLSEKQSYSSEQIVPLSSNQEKIVASLEKNNPSKPFSFKQCQEFSDITFFSNSQMENMPRFQENCVEATVSV